MIHYGWWKQENKNLITAVLKTVEVKVSITPNDMLEILECLNEDELSNLICEILAKHDTKFSKAIAENIAEAIGD